MKAKHRAFLASDRWATMLREDLLPWLLAAGPLGDDVLEIGPGPGLTTDLLRQLTPAVTALELDARLAEQLKRRLADTNVAVMHADAARSQFADGRFSAVACFHVLHHVPSRLEQDALFREVARVLRPGGMFLCVDAMDTAELRAAHTEQHETFMPVDPTTISDRLHSAGLSQVELRQQAYQLLIRATRRD